jgi:predicted RNA-binding protein with PUA-like domain
MENPDERRYWLMKTEPSTFSFDDLKKAKNATTSWEGVRNYQARNLLRDKLKVGDGVLFYHSNIAKPAIMGLARVVREGYPDETALDPGSEYYDPRAGREKPIWYMVDIQYAADLPAPLNRDDLKKHPVLSKMAVLKKGNRLSVQPVTKEEWDAVILLTGVGENM